jgi:hypothetical protein
MPDTRPLCRCVWQQFHCDKEATQEDGLCDWCGTRNPEDMQSNPFAQFDRQTGKYLGLAGGTVTGYNHQAGWGEIPDGVRPTACWMPDSGRTLNCLTAHGLGCSRA